MAPVEVGPRVFSGTRLAPVFEANALVRALASPGGMPV